MELDGLDGGPYVMEAVDARLDHLEVEVELGPRRERDGQRWVDFSPARYLTARSW